MSETERKKDGEKKKKKKGKEKSDTKKWQQCDNGIIIWRGDHYKVIFHKRSTPEFLFISSLPSFPPPSSNDAGTKGAGGMGKKYQSEQNEEWRNEKKITNSRQ